jgi:hypothetical protein
VRLARPFGERTTASQSREVKRKFFLVFEGEKTECQYFEGINDYRNELRIDALVEMRHLLRSTGREHESNPKRIIEQLIKHLTETIKYGISCESLIERICDYLFVDTKIAHKNSVINQLVVQSDLRQFFTGKLGYSPKSIVTNIQNVLVECEAFLKDKYGFEHSADLIAEYIVSSEVILDKEFDIVCLIVDRDQQSFKMEQYDYVLNECLKHHFEFYVTNPCFEFWLLLHCHGINELDRRALLENHKDKLGKRYIQKELVERLNGSYNKKKEINFECFKDKVDLAIKQAQNYCEDIRELKTNLGSNVGKLITGMRNVE